jgi:hypothetical protein
MAFGYHASDELKPLLGCVNLAFAVIVASNEKGSFGIVGCEEVEKVTCVLAWAIVESKSNRPFLEAMLDPLVIRDITNEWSCVCRSVSA